MRCDLCNKRAMILGLIRDTTILQCEDCHIHLLNPVVDTIEDNIYWENHKKISAKATGIMYNIIILEEQP